MATPFSYLSDRVSLSPRVLRLASLTALIVSIIIVFTGGVVRVTSSGLGCPTWPACDPSSLVPTAELGIHGVIEFSNRLFTGVIIVAVGWVIVAARLQRPRNRSITRLAWSQFWLVVANAVAGGVTVLTALNPWVVAMHFVMAVALLTTTTLTWQRTRDISDEDASRGRVSSGAMTGGTRMSQTASALSWALAGATLILVLAGTLVSGSGPHSGDSAAVPRMPFNWTGITVVHGILGAATLAIAVALWLVLSRDENRTARKRVSAFLVVTVLQAAVGVTQAFTGLPEILVAIHLLGAALVWVGVLRVLLEVNPTLFRGPSMAQTLPERVISL
ncbi:MAG: heme a synthase [Microbacteriaceae bacterium]|jgi:cytochrome c oxidase assembly protein subunit 15|nr:heme a synthase [Microbacteriaceae bacterium]MDQ1553561.1 heme a synthase [Microbacteriaceae bacterium]